MARVTLRLKGRDRNYGRQNVLGRVFLPILPWDASFLEGLHVRVIHSSFLLNLVNRRLRGTFPGAVSKIVRLFTLSNSQDRRRAQDHLRIFPILRILRVTVLSVNLLCGARFRFFNVIVWQVEGALCVLHLIVPLFCLNQVNFRLFLRVFVGLVIKDHNVNNYAYRAVLRRERTIRRVKERVRHRRNRRRRVRRISRFLTQQYSFLLKYRLVGSFLLVSFRWDSVPPSMYFVFAIVT